MATRRGRSWPLYVAVRENFDFTTSHIRCCLRAFDAFVCIQTRQVDVSGIWRYMEASVALFESMALYRERGIILRAWRDTESVASRIIWRYIEDVALHRYGTVYLKGEEGKAWRLVTDVMMTCRCYEILSLVLGVFACFRRF